jgi:nuclear transport factor 2 (NTF2) superfamily protein
MVKEEEADRIPKELSTQLQSRMVYKRDGSYFYSAGKWYRCYGGEKEKAEPSCDGIID